MYRNKTEIITLLLAKELTCNNTVAKHNDIYPLALLFFGCDPASASSLISSAFPLTILPLPGLIKAKKRAVVFYMHFLLFWLQIFYVPLFAFLAESKSTHFESAEQSEFVFSSSLNAVIVVINVDISINSYEFGHFTCWVRHQKNVKPNTFGLQLCILVKYYSVQTCTITVKLFIASEPCHTVTLQASLFPHNPLQDFTPLYSTLTWTVSSLHISSFLLELYDCYAAWQWTGLSCTHSSASACSPAGSTICSQDRSSSAQDSLETT